MIYQNFVPTAADNEPENYCKNCFIGEPLYIRNFR